MIDYCYGNLLYRRVYENFLSDITSRYFVLREGPLSNDNINKQFTDFFNSIDPQYYESEMEMWPDVTYHDTNNLENILYFAKMRGIVLDKFFQALENDLQPNNNFQGKTTINY